MVAAVLLLHGVAALLDGYLIYSPRHTHVAAKPLVLAAALLAVIALRGAAAAGAGLRAATRAHSWLLDACVPSPVPACCEKR